MDTLVYYRPRRRPSSNLTHPIKDAQDNTGPARRKKRGRNAGQPKKLEDVFNWSSVTEHLKDIIYPDRNGKKPPISEDDKQLFISWAEECCTPLQTQYVRMHHGDGQTLRQIANSLDKAPSTVRECYQAAMKRIHSNCTIRWRLYGDLLTRLRSAVRSAITPPLPPTGFRVKTQPPTNG